MISDEELDLAADRAIDMLNDALQRDPVAISALVAARVPCNEVLADHDTIQVWFKDGEYRIGLLGVLNGLFGKHNDGYGRIAAVVDDDVVTSFIRTPYPAVKP